MQPHYSIPLDPDTMPHGSLQSDGYRGERSSHNMYEDHNQQDHRQNQNYNHNQHSPQHQPRGPRALQAGSSSPVRGANRLDQQYYNHTHSQNQNQNYGHNNNYNQNHHQQTRENQPSQADDQDFEIVHMSSKDSPNIYKSPAVAGYDYVSPSTPTSNPNHQGRQSQHNQPNQLGSAYQTQSTLQVPSHPLRIDTNTTPNTTNQSNQYAFPPHTPTLNTQPSSSTSTTAINLSPERTKPNGGINSTSPRRERKAVRRKPVGSSISSITALDPEAPKNSSPDQTLNQFSRPVSGAASSQYSGQSPGQVPEQFSKLSVSSPGPYQTAPTGPHPFRSLAQASTQSSAQNSSQSSSQNLAQYPIQNSCQTSINNNSDNNNSTNNRIYASTNATTTTNNNDILQDPVQHQTSNASDGSSDESVPISPKKRTHWSPLKPAEHKSVEKSLPNPDLGDISSSPYQSQSSALPLPPPISSFSNEYRNNNNSHSSINNNNGNDKFNHRRTYSAAGDDETGFSNQAKRSSVLYMGSNNAVPNFSTPTQFRSTSISSIGNNSGSSSGGVDGTHGVSGANGANPISVKNSNNSDFGDNRRDQQSQRPVSMIEMSQSSMYILDDGTLVTTSNTDNSYNTYDSYNQHQHLPIPHDASIAVGVPKFTTATGPTMLSATSGAGATFSSDFSPSALKQWKYHIQKNMADFYMTTNPDSDHINAPKAPAYYVELKTGEAVSSIALSGVVVGNHGGSSFGSENKTGSFSSNIVGGSLIGSGSSLGIGSSSKNKEGRDLPLRVFTMALINVSTQFKEVEVTRCFRNDLHGNSYEDFFDITVYKKKDHLDQSEQFDFAQVPKNKTDLYTVGGGSGSEVDETLLRKKQSYNDYNDNDSVVAWQAQAFAVPPGKRYGTYESSAVAPLHSSSSAVGAGTSSLTSSSGLNYHSLKPILSNAGSSFSRELHAGISSLNNLRSGFSFGGDSHNKYEREGLESGVNRDEKEKKDSDKKNDYTFRQYIFADDRGRQWVVGNRQMHFGSDVVLPEDSDEMEMSGVECSSGSNSSKINKFNNFSSPSFGGGNANETGASSGLIIPGTNANASHANIVSNAISTSSGSSMTRVKKRSTRVYFFSPGPNGSQSDKVMAVLQRRKQIHKQLVKDFSRFAHRATASINDRIDRIDKSDKFERGEKHERNERGERIDKWDDMHEDSGSAKRFFKSLVSSSSASSSAPDQNSLSNTAHNKTLNNNDNICNTNVNTHINTQPPPMGVTYVNIPENPLTMVEEEDQDKFGWLTVFENVKHRSGLWPVVTAMTMAVAYAQRIDTKERSLQEKFKNLGRKYKEARKNVYYGHRHTQSSV